MIRLMYLQTLFWIERAATKYSGERTDQCVLVAADMLNWVNDAVVRRERLSLAGYTNLAWKVSVLKHPSFFFDTHRSHPIPYS